MRRSKTMACEGSHSTRSASAGLLAVLACVLSEAAAATAPACPRTLWPGFDSRLEVDVLEIVEQPEKVVDIGLAGENLCVACEHAVVLRREREALRVPVLPEVERLVLSDVTRLRVETSRGKFRISSSGIERGRWLGAPEDCRVEGDGHAALLCVRRAGDVTRLDLVNEAGDGLPLGELAGEVGPVAWNEHGLAVLRGESLVIWRNEERRLTELALGIGAELVRDLALTRSGTVIVSSRSSTWAVSGAGATIVALTPTRLSVDGERVLMLDLATGHLVLVRGVEHLGDREDDEAHLEQLLETVRAAPAEAERALGEAARLAGCEEVRHRLSRERHDGDRRRACEAAAGT